jgi:hypothetical protein
MLVHGSGNFCAQPEKAMPGSALGWAGCSTSPRLRLDLAQVLTLMVRGAPEDS